MCSIRARWRTTTHFSTTPSASTRSARITAPARPLDLALDQTDRDAGKTILCPALAIWGASGIPAASSSPLDAWRASFAPKIEGGAVESGHFVAEENPGATLDLLIPFLTA